MSEARKLTMIVSVLLLIAGCVFILSGIYLCITLSGPEGKYLDIVYGGAEYNPNVLTTLGGLTGLNVAGIALLFLNAGIEILTGIVGIIAARRVQVVLPFFICSIISLVAAAVAFIIAVVGGALGDVPLDFNSLVLSICGCVLSVIAIYAAKSDRRALA